MNFVRGAIQRDGSRQRFVAPGFSLPLPDGKTMREGAVVVGVRPHDIALDGQDNTGVRGVVSLVEPLGSEQIVYVSVPGGQDLVAAVGADWSPRIDESVGLRISPAAAHFFDPDSGARLALGG